MESIAVTKQDMTLARQDSLSPFGLLTQLFTAELLRRSGQTIGSYRPMQLAYLEEEESAAVAPPPEIHIDLNLDLIVNRLLKETQAQEKEKNEKTKTPTERIIERVILREREIRTAYQDTRRVVIESGGQRTTVNLPADKAAQTPASTKQITRTVRDRVQETRQAGEGRSAGKPDAPRRSADLARPTPAVITSAPTEKRKLPHRELTLASQAMSAPAAGGWTPQEREVHPGFSPRAAKPQDSLAVGSILLPDVLRRRREAAMERSRTPEPRPAARDIDALSEDILTWATEGTEQTSETERVVRAVRRAVQETLRRNEMRAAQPQEAARARQTESPSERIPSPAYRHDAQTRTEAETRTQNAVSAASQYLEQSDQFTPEATPRATTTVPETQRQKAAQAVSAAEGADADQLAELVYRTQTKEPEAEAAALPREQTEQRYAPAETVQTSRAEAEARKQYAAVQQAQAGTGTHPSHPTVPFEKPERTQGGVSAEENTVIRTAAHAAPAPQTAMPAAEPEAGASEPTELIFRTQTEAPAPQTAAEAAADTREAYERQQTPRETASTPYTAAHQSRAGTEVQPTRPAAPLERPDGRQRGASAEHDTVTGPEMHAVPAPQTAMPAADPEAGAAEPAEIIYRTQTEEPTAEAADFPQEKAERRQMSHETAQQNHPETQKQPQAPATRLRTVTEERAGHIQTATGARQPHTPAGQAHPEAEAHPAHPAKAGTARDGASEEENTGSLTAASAGPAPRTAIPVEEPEAGASASAALMIHTRTDASSPQTAAEETAFPQRQNERQQTPGETALPAVSEADASEPAELVYRAETEGPLPQTAAGTDAYPPEQDREPTESRQTPGETALPAAAEADASVPAELIYRAGAIEPAAEAPAVRQAQQTERMQTTAETAPPAAAEAKGQTGAAAKPGQPAHPAAPSAKADGTQNSRPIEGKTAAQPAPAASAPVQPTSAGPKSIQPVSTEPTSAQPTPAESAPARLASQEPISTQPFPAETAFEEPASEGPAPQTAIPAMESGTDASVPPELIYRTETEEPAQQTKAETAALPQTQQRQSEGQKPSGEGTPPAAAEAKGQTHFTAQPGQSARPASPSPKADGTQTGVPEEEKMVTQTVPGQPVPAVPTSAESTHEAPVTAEPATAKSAATVPATAELTTAEPAPQMAIPAMEPGMDASVPAELIYRTEAAEPTPQTAGEAAAASQAQQQAIKGQEPSGRPAPTATAEAKGRGNPASESGQAVHPAEASARSAGTQDGVAAESITAPKTAAPRESMPAESAPAEQTSTEQASAESAPRTAIPAAETAAAASEPTELIYRAEQPAPAPETAVEAAAFAQEQFEKPQTSRAPAQQPQAGTQPQPERPAARPTETGGRQDAAPAEEPPLARLEIPEAPAPQTAIPAAEPGAEISEPTELIYRAEQSAPMPQTAAKTGDLVREQAENRRTSRAPAQPQQAEAKQTRAGTQQQQQQQQPQQTAAPLTRTDGTRNGAHAIEEETGYPARDAGPAPRTAIPAAEAETVVSTPAELIYRADDTAAAQEAGTSETTGVQAQTHTAAQQRGTSAPQAEAKAAAAGTPRGAAMPETAQTPPATKPTVTPARDALSEPGSFPAEEASPAAAAIPAAEAEAEMPAELIYRPLTGAPLQQGEARPGTPAPPARPARPEPGAMQTQHPTALTARDIRMTAPTRHGAARTGSGEEASAYAGPAAQRADGEIPEEEETQAPVTAVPVTEEAEGAAPPEIFYAAPAYSAEPQQQQPAAARPTERAPQQRMKGEMPAWAKELMEKAGVKDTVEQVPILPGQSWASSGKQITWTAPSISNPIQSVRMNDAADLTYKERAQTEEESARPSISQAEIERTADRVYHILEERLRRELRRSGR